MTAAIPKAELHCHIEGAADPALVVEQARKYGADVSAIIRDGAYVWHDFTSFLVAYDLAASLFRTAADYAMLAERHLTGLAAQGAIYAEFFISIDHARSSGTDPNTYVEGLAEGIGRATAATGIEARMIAIGVRHLGPDAVVATARWHRANPHPLITGFGMAGDERHFDTRDFAPAFEIARDAGFGITVHAGELTGAQTVRDSLDFLGPARIGHGVRAIEDESLVERIAAEEIVLEVCPVSNVALQVFADFASHPLPRLAHAGCKVTLNSDDPPFFHTSLAREYEIAQAQMGFTPVQLVAATATAINAAFVDGETRTRLLARCAVEGIA
jgi:adenosine deaminase